MAQKFLLKAYYNKGGKDPFGFSEPKDFYIFYCSSIRDLRATMRCITAKGYRIPKPATLSSRIKDWLSSNPPGGIIELKNPLLQTRMYEIKRFNGIPGTLKKLDFTNSFNFTHKLKIAETEF